MGNLEISGLFKNSAKGKQHKYIKKFLFLKDYRYVNISLTIDKNISLKIYE